MGSCHHRVLEHEKRGRVSVRVVPCEKDSPHMAGFEGGGRGHEPKDAGGFLKPEKVEERILPLEPQEGTQPGRHLSLPRWDPG